MKLKIVTIAIGLSLAISVAQGTPVLNIFEAGEQLFATFNGGPASFVTITSIKPPCGGQCGEEFNIVFSSGWKINQDAFFALGSFIEVGEPEGGVDQTGHPFENIINADPDNDLTLHWHSEQAGAAFGVETVMPVSEGLIDPTGNKFDVILADVPEPCSTISIFGIGLAGLAWFGRFRRTAM